MAGIETILRVTNDDGQVVYIWLEKLEMKLSNEAIGEQRVTLSGIVVPRMTEDGWQRHCELKKKVLDTNSPIR